MAMGGKEVIFSQAPTPEKVERHNRGEANPRLVSPVLGHENPGAQTLHGSPITISQCTFQAHIARVTTEAEVKAVSEAVSATTEHEAGFSDFVGAFAYRLACVGHRAQRLPRNLGDRDRGGPEDDSDSEEGYCDNGDVGSGEKLLHLLQKWDVRHRVLMVTRIDGGFMMTELMGVRRYRFVVDRAKKLLETTELASLRRAVDTDIHPPTTAETNTILAAHEQAILGGTGGGGGGLSEAGWDRLIVPISVRKRISGHTVHRNLLGAPRANSGGDLIPPPCKNSFGAEGSRGRGRGAKLRAKQNAINAGGCATSGAGSTRTRARRVLSLGHLSISSKTVPFPRGHVPSVMGAKGHGKKRGRINHFAVRTPPATWLGEDDDGDGDGTGGGGRGRYVGDGVDPSDGSSGFGSASADDARGRQALTSGWSLLHELDPTSTVTGPGRRLEGSSRGGANNCSVHTASRVSTCDTINSPGRVAAIMLGVTGAHTALPPPPYGARTTSDGDGSSSTSGGGFRLETASLPDVDIDGSSAVDSSHRRPQPVLPGMNSSGAGHFGRNDDTMWAGGFLQHHPAGVAGGAGGIAVPEGVGCSSPGAWAAAGHEMLNFSGVDGCVFPPTGGGGGGGVAEGGNGAARPLLHRAPGSGVRDQPPLSLVIVPGGGSGGGGATAAPLSNGSTVGRWKSDDNGSSISINSPVAGAETSAGNKNKNDAENSPSSPTGFALVGRRSSHDDRQQQPGGRAALAAETTAADPPLSQQAQCGVHREEESPRGPRRKECDTPATWGSDDLADLRGIVSGRSDPPPTRSKSALRGWSVDRVAPACSPLVTQKRGTQSKTGR